jgi:hypothetical protein
MVGMAPGVMPVGIDEPDIEPIIIERSNIMTLDIYYSFCWLNAWQLPDAFNDWFQRSLWWPQSADAQYSKKTSQWEAMVEV